MHGFLKPLFKEGQKKKDDPESYGPGHKILRLTWNSKLSRKKNTEMMLTKFNKQFCRVSRVFKYLTKKGKTKFIEGILLSQIRYGLEITTGGMGK